jgi:hypothetical protein
MQRTILHGVSAGALAGLLLAGILFVDYSPGGNLAQVARWFGLGGGSGSQLVGVLLLVIVGALFGGVLALLTSRWADSLTQFVLTGTLMGLLWWAILVLLLGIGLQKTRMNPYGMLYWLAVSLFYGLSLGSLFGQLQIRKMDHEQRTI